MRTHLILIIDKSGSINRRGASIKRQVVQSVNKLVAEQRKIGEDCTVQVFQFSNDLVVGSVQPITQFSFTESEYVTKGNTHLHDAVCDAFDQSGQYLASLPNEQRPEKVVAVIVTDGLERGSTRFSREDVVQRVRHQTEQYSWQVILLQGNYCAKEAAESLGIDAENAIRFTSSNGGVEAAMAKVSNQTSNYRIGRAKSLAFGGRTARIDLTQVVANS